MLGVRTTTSAGNFTGVTGSGRRQCCLEPWIWMTCLVRCLIPHNVIIHCPNSHSYFNSHNAPLQHECINRFLALSPLPPSGHRFTIACRGRNCNQLRGRFVTSQQPIARTVSTGDFAVTHCRLFGLRGMRSGYIEVSVCERLCSGRVPGVRNFLISDISEFCILLLPGP
jgi:hypothetical protein